VYAVVACIRIDRVGTGEVTSIAIITADFDLYSDGASRSDLAPMGCRPLFMSAGPGR